MNRIALIRSRDRLLERAIDAEQKGQLNKALQLLEQIKSEFPDNIDAHLIEARIWIRQGHIGAAQCQLEQLIDKASDNVEVRLTLVGLLFCLGHYDQAINHLLVAAKNYKQEPGAESAPFSPAHDQTLNALWKSYIESTPR